MADAIELADLTPALKSILGPYPPMFTAYACATASITLSGTQTVDDQALSVGSICFALGQGFNATNGLYVVQSGAWTRPTWLPSGGTFRAGAVCGVTHGTLNKGLWTNVNTGGTTVTVDTTTQFWTRIPSVIGTNRATLADAATILVDGSTTNAYRIYDHTFSTSGRTMGNPSGSYDGQEFIFRLKQGASGGPYTVVWGSKYRFPGVTPVLSVTASATDIFRFVRHATDDKFDMVGFTPAAPVQVPIALTDAATIATDASLGDTFAVTLGGNRTMGAPTNPLDGKKILYRIRQDGTGTRTLAWNAIFRFGTDVVSPTLTTTINKTDYIGFIYSFADTKWDCLAVVKGY